MTIQELIKRYEAKRKTYGNSAFRHISSLLKEVKEMHKKKFGSGYLQKNYQS